MIQSIIAGVLLLALVCRVCFLVLEYQPCLWQVFKLLVVLVVDRRRDCTEFPCCRAPLPKKGKGLWQHTSSTSQWWSVLALWLYHFWGSIISAGMWSALCCVLMSGSGYAYIIWTLESVFCSRSSVAPSSNPSYPVPKCACPICMDRLDEIVIKLWRLATWIEARPRLKKKGDSSSIFYVLRFRLCDVMCTTVSNSQIYSSLLKLIF